jgi:hypothetical protein
VIQTPIWKVGSLNQVFGTMKLLLAAMAILEGSTGIALLLIPAGAVSMLLGAPLDTPASLVVGRITGGALVALGLSCWGARRDEHNPAANGIVSAMLLYNTTAVAVLAHAGLGWRLMGVGLWPAVVLHALIAVSCLVCLWESLNKSKLRER